MNYLYSKHINHRILTAEIVLYKDNGAALVVDFRLASFIYDDNKENLKGVQVLRHSVPEVALGTYDFASDVYSFGMFLYSIITCKPLKNLDVLCFKDGFIFPIFQRSLFQRSVSNVSMFKEKLYRKDRPFV